ncbi:MAG: DUF3891 family protein, partial [Algoriphagus sp.]
NLSYRLDGLSAITDHDDSQADWHKSDNLTDAGAPLDYRQAGQMKIKEVKKMIENCLHKSAFMTLMVSMHCLSIYKDQKGKAVKSFMDDQKDLCQFIQSHLHVTNADAEKSYRILRFCDELSLMLCQQDIPTNSRKIQLEPLPGIEENFIHLDENGILRLDHWCFESSEFTLSGEYYRTKKLSYTSDAELIAELKLGNPLFTHYKFKK